MIKGHLQPAETAWVRQNIITRDFDKVGDLKGKTLFITGASRGIGLAIALKAAKDGKMCLLQAPTLPSLLRQLSLIQNSLVLFTPLLKKSRKLEARDLLSSATSEMKRVYRKL